MQPRGFSTSLLFRGRQSEPVDVCGRAHGAAGRWYFSQISGSNRRSGKRVWRGGRVRFNLRKQERAGDSEVAVPRDYRLETVVISFICHFHCLLSSASDYGKQYVAQSWQRALGGAGVTRFQLKGKRFFHAARGSTCSAPSSVPKWNWNQTLYLDSKLLPTQDRPSLWAPTQAVQPPPQTLR